MAYAGSSGDFWGALIFALIRLSPSLEILSTPPPPGQVEIDLQQNVRLVERLMLRKIEVGNYVLTITISRTAVFAGYKRNGL